MITVRIGHLLWYYNSEKSTHIRYIEKGTIAELRKAINLIKITMNWTYYFIITRRKATGEIHTFSRQFWWDTFSKDLGKSVRHECVQRPTQLFPDEYMRWCAQGSVQLSVSQRIGAERDWRLCWRSEFIISDARVWRLQVSVQQWTMHWIGTYLRCVTIISFVPY